MRGPTAPVGTPLPTSSLSRAPDIPTPLPPPAPLASSQAQGWNWDTGGGGQGRGETGPLLSLSQCSSPSTVGKHQRVGSGAGRHPPLPTPPQLTPCPLQAKRRRDLEAELRDLSNQVGGAWREGGGATEVSLSAPPRPPTS